MIPSSPCTQYAGTVRQRCGIAEEVVDVASTVAGVADDLEPSIQNGHLISPQLSHFTIVCGAGLVHRKAPGTAIPSRKQRAGNAEQV